MALILLVSALGCGSEPEPETPPENECLAPNRRVADRCLEPGVQDDGCPAGTLGREDGSCVPAGVPAELCAEGFVHDGDAACEPILPAEPCPKGQLAVPGENACHSLMACGAGDWGDIPVDGATVYVNAAYPGLDSDGTLQKPWTAIADAVSAAPDGALIAVASGSYAENVTVNESLRLWGVCPERVEIDGTLSLGPNADASEVHGIALTGMGLVVTGADVVIGEVWVHDTLQPGLTLQGSASATLRNALVEDCRELGVFVLGSNAVFESIVVRGTLPRSGDLAFGIGINVQLNPDTGVASTASMRASVVEQNHDVGIFVGASEMTFEGSVVRGTKPRAYDQAYGRGIELQHYPPTGAPTKAVIRSSLIEKNHENGLLVIASDATLEGVVLRDIFPQQSDQEFGRGITVQPDAETGATATALIRSSLLDRNSEVGMLLGANGATIEGVKVRGTRPRASDRAAGGGIGIQESVGTVLVRGSVVEQNHETGVVVMGSQATLEGVVVRGTAPREDNRTGGRGIAIEQHPMTGVTSTALVKSSLVEANHDVGVLVLGADATLEALLVRGVEPRVADGLLGDGVAVVVGTSTGVTQPAAAHITRSLIDHAARAGISSFGTHVALGESALVCNGFDLDGQDIGLTSTFEDLGKNQCGCPSPTNDCAMRSSGVAPPEAVEPL